MKNLKRLLILLILCVPCFVKADMGAPMLREFEMVVVNPDGVDYEPFQYSDVADPHLAKDQVVIVESEYGGKYSILLKEEDGTKTSIGYISSLDGFSIVKEEVDPTKTENDPSIIKYDSKQKAIVYNEKGVNIYQGPSKIYKNIGTIKKGTKLEYQYAIDGEGGITYIYVDYNGKKGWVDILEKNVLIENEVQYIFRIDVDTECGVIPKNTIIKPEYKTDRWSKSALFNYNKCSSMLYVFKSDEILPLYNGKAKSKVDIAVYEDPDKTNLITTIPANTEFIYYTGTDATFGSLDIQYVEYDGKKGWSFAALDDFEITKIEYNDYAKLDNKKEVKKEKTKATKKETKKSDKILNIDSKEFVIICASAGIILSLTAIVIIVLVNKKKKAKKNKIVEENVNDNNNNEE